MHCRGVVPPSGFGRPAEGASLMASARGLIVLALVVGGLAWAARRASRSHASPSWLDWSECDGSQGQ